MGKIAQVGICLFILLTIGSRYFNTSWGWKKSVSTFTASHAGPLQDVGCVVVVKWVFTGWICAIERYAFEAINSRGWNKNENTIGYSRYCVLGTHMHTKSDKNSKRFWTKIRLKQATDSIQNSSGKPNHQGQLGNQITRLRAIGKPNHQGKDNWETKSLS